MPPGFRLYGSNPFSTEEFKRNRSSTIPTWVGFIYATVKSLTKQLWKEPGCGLAPKRLPFRSPFRTLREAVEQTLDGRRLPRSASTAVTKPGGDIGGTSIRWTEHGFLSGIGWGSMTGFRGSRDVSGLWVEKKGCPPRYLVLLRWFVPN